MRHAIHVVVHLGSVGTIVCAIGTMMVAGCARGAYHAGSTGDGMAGSIEAGGGSVGPATTGSRSLGGSAVRASTTSLSGGSGGTSGILVSGGRYECGNGRQDLDLEQCDDGNQVSGDGCSHICLVEARWTCPTWGQPCVLLCGNGVVDPGEECDDSNRISSDGCSNDCQTIEAGWRCRVPGKACSPVCGDALLLGNETCDDGNTRGGDGCSRACQVEPGYVCLEPGKLCRPLPCTGGGADVAPCDGGAPRVSVCGDGIVSGDEECDDGNGPAYPRNDDNAYGGCTTRCTIGGYCGDGVTNGPESCDDGTVNLPSYGSPGCSFACQRTHTCGDGIADTVYGEDCDLGPGLHPPCMSDCHYLIGP